METGPNDASGASFGPRYVFFFYLNTFSFPFLFY